MRSLVLAILVCLAAPAAASDLATPGACAEADPQSLRIGLELLDGGAPTPTGGAASLSRAAGPVRHRLTPTDVSAAAPSPSLAPPTPDGATHPGACNSASSVCGGAIQSNPRPTAVPTPRTTPRTAPTRRPPVARDLDPNTGCGGPGFSC